MKCSITMSNTHSTIIFGLQDFTKDARKRRENDSTLTADEWLNFQHRIWKDVGEPQFQ